MDIIYKRKAFYYETDKMAIVHHSNYIRWLEEARIYYFEQIGVPFHKLEETGIVSPVVSVNVKYKKSVVFNEEIIIKVKVTKFNGVKLTMEYEIFSKENGELKTLGVTEHCFLNEQNQIVSLKRTNLNFYQRIMENLEK